MSHRRSRANWTVCATLAHSLILFESSIHPVENCCKECSGHSRNRLPIVHIAGCDHRSQQLPAIIDNKADFEAIEPAGVTSKHVIARGIEKLTLAESVPRAVLSVTLASSLFSGATLATTRSTDSASQCPVDLSMSRARS